MRSGTPSSQRSGRCSATRSSTDLFANIGFALVMFVVGTHVPVGDKTLRSAIPKAMLRAVAVGAVVVTAALPSPKSNRYLAIGVASVSLEAEASAMTVSGAAPELGVTEIRAVGAASVTGPGWNS